MIINSVSAARAVNERVNASESAPSTMPAVTKGSRIAGRTPTTPPQSPQRIFEPPTPRALGSVEEPSIDSWSRNELTAPPKRKYEVGTSSPVGDGAKSPKRLRTPPTPGVPNSPISSITPAQKRASRKKHKIIRKGRSPDAIYIPIQPNFARKKTMPAKVVTDQMHESDSGCSMGMSFPLLIYSLLRSKFYDESASADSRNYYRGHPIKG